MPDDPPPPSVIAATARAFLSRIGWTLAHPSPLRWLLLVSVTIAVTHSFTMLSLHVWHAVLPAWAHSFVESAPLVIVLFPALDFFSCRPLILTSVHEALRLPGAARGAPGQLRERARA